MGIFKRRPFSPLSYKDIDAAAFAELVESERRHRRLLELSHDLILEIDMNGVIVHASPSSLMVLGYVPEKLIGQSAFDLIHIAERTKAVSAIMGVKKVVESERLIMRMLHNDTSFRWVEAVWQATINDKNETIGRFAVIRDVTEQHDAVTRLSQANVELSMFKLAASNAFNHIIISDTEGKILFANQGAETLTGYKKAEMLGQTPALWGGQMSNDFYKNFWDTIKNKKRPFHGEIINKKKNGSLYRAIATVSPIIDDTDTLIGFVGVEEDISHLNPPESKK